MKKKIFIISGILLLLIAGIALTGYMGYRYVNEKVPDIRNLMSMYGPVPENAGFFDKTSVYYHEWRYMRKALPLIDLEEIDLTTDTTKLKSYIDSLLMSPLYQPERLMWKVFIIFTFIRWEELDCMESLNYIVTLSKTLPPDQFDELKMVRNPALITSAVKNPEGVLSYYSANQVEADKIFSINSTIMYSYLSLLLTRESPEKGWNFIQTLPPGEQPYMISFFINGFDHNSSELLPYLKKMDLKNIFGVKYKIPEYNPLTGIDHANNEIVENPVESALRKLYQNYADDNLIDWLKTQDEDIRLVLFPSILSAKYKNHSFAQKDILSDDQKDDINAKRNLFIEELNSLPLPGKEETARLILENKSPQESMLWISEYMGKEYSGKLMDEFFKDWVTQNKKEAGSWLDKAEIAPEAKIRLEEILKTFAPTQPTN